MADSRHTHLCPICYVDRKNEPLRPVFENATYFIKVCVRCGFQAHFIKDNISSDISKRNIIDR